MSEKPRGVHPAMRAYVDQLKDLESKILEEARPKDKSGK